jgi:hypothetical protein
MAPPSIPAQWDRRRRILILPEPSFNPFELLKIKPTMDRHVVLDELRRQRQESFDIFVDTRHPLFELTLYISSTSRQEASVYLSKYMPK